MIKPHLSLNGVSGTLWEIRRQENVHPYLGLRQAILIIDTQEKALKEGRLSQKRTRLRLERQEQLVLEKKGLELEILLDEIELAKHELQSFDQLIIDAETELTTAKEEKRRIELLNPIMVAEVDDASITEYANEAFQCKLARAVVISAYSSCKMISEGAAEVIYDSACLPETDKQKFEARVVGQLMQMLPPEPTPGQFLETNNGGTNGITVTRN